MREPRMVKAAVAIVVGVCLGAAGCGSSNGSAVATGRADTETAVPACFTEPDQAPIDLDDTTDVAGTKLTLVAYDSFFVSEGVFELFEEDTGITVEVLTSADTGTMVSEAVLTAGNPIGDVMWGIDNTFLCRGLEAGIFAPYQSKNLEAVSAEVQLDPFHRVTPVDVSDMCINYSLAELQGDAPQTLTDLADPQHEGELVTQNPETSAPGMGLLLATIAEFGEDGWKDYWRTLVDNDLAVTPGWSEAYYGEFVAGGGDRSIVMSYATSPVAELIFADPPVEEPPTAALLGSCFRSVEFAGVLAGTDHPEASAMLVDFLLSQTFQEDIALNMFVFPTNQDAELPPEFVRWAPLSESPYSIAPEIIEANRATWTEEWTDIVLR